MAVGVNSRDSNLNRVLQSILDRLFRAEHPNSLHIGGVGTGFTIHVNPAGQLIAVSDAAATVTVLALP